MKLTRTLFALIATVLVIATAAVGQDEDVSNGVASDNEVVENPAAAGRKSPGELRRDFWRAERDFYAIYNKLNEDSIYDVRCTREAPTGRLIKSQTCRPKFLDKALKDGKIRKGAVMDTEISAKAETYRKNLEALIAASPDLQAAAAALNRAHAELEAGREKIADD